jgi:prepilin-type N-terminal cleavage/methylation domain-containing protein
MLRFRCRLTGGFTLVEMLVVAVILVAIAAFILPSYLGGVSKDGKKGATPMGRARGTVCSSNIRQVRMSIDMAQQTDDEGKFPQSLEELRGLPSEFHKCPDSGEKYVYDAATGKVTCPHPGHERF